MGPKPKNLPGPPAPVTDPYFSSVVYLADFEGADEATTFDEQSSGEHVLTFGGNAQLDTAQSRIGTSSIMFDRTAGTWLTAAASTDFNMTNEDFTIEFDVRWNGDPGGNNSTLVEVYQTSPANRCWIVDNSSGANLRFLYSTDGSSTTILSVSWNPAGDTWYTIAVTRNGANVRLYVDGSQVGSTQDMSTDSINVPSPTQGIDLGGSDVGGSPPIGFSLLDGWMENVRVTVGVARYTGSSYTVPTEAFPTS